jgi:hypothetical protein
MNFCQYPGCKEKIFGKFIACSVHHKMLTARIRSMLWRYPRSIKYTEEAHKCWSQRSKSESSTISTTQEP